MFVLGCTDAQYAAQQQIMDPCEQATFNPQACQMAMGAGGYNYGGMWYPMVYSHPYNYYYGGYHTYVVHGGVVRSRPYNAYSTIHTPTTRVYHAPVRTSPYNRPSPYRSPIYNRSPIRSSPSFRSSYRSYSSPSRSYSSGHRR